MCLPRTNLRKRIHQLYKAPSAAVWRLVSSMERYLGAPDCWHEEGLAGECKHFKRPTQPTSVSSFGRSSGSDANSILFDGASVIRHSKGQGFGKHGNLAKGYDSELAEIPYSLSQSF